MVYIFIGVVLAIFAFALIHILTTRNDNLTKVDEDDRIDIKQQTDLHVMRQIYINETAESHDLDGNFRDLDQDTLEEINDKLNNEKDT